MARRDLGEVLHYFIPEEEQRAARAAAAAVPSTPARTAPPAPARAAAPTPRAVSRRWAMIASASRPLLVGLAIDLASAWAKHGRVHLVALHPRHALLPSSEQVLWHTTDALADALSELADQSAPTLVLLPWERGGEELARLEHAGLHGLIVPVEGSGVGVARALGLLRRFGSAAQRIRVGALALGARRTDSRALLRTFESASWRQLGIAVEPLGALERDPQGYRALLEGQAAPAADGSAEYVRGLREVSERL